jgi:hypothetical protein
MSYRQVACRQSANCTWTIHSVSTTLDSHVQLNSLRTRSRDSVTEGENTGFCQWKKEGVGEALCRMPVRSEAFGGSRAAVKGLPITLRDYCSQALLQDQLPFHAQMTAYASDNGETSTPMTANHRPVSANPCLSVSPAAPACLHACVSSTPQWEVGNGIMPDRATSALIRGTRIAVTALRTAAMVGSHPSRIRHSLGPQCQRFPLSMSRISYPDEMEAEPRRRPVRCWFWCRLSVWRWAEWELGKAATSPAPSATGGDLQKSGADAVLARSPATTECPAANHSGQNLPGGVWLVTSSQPPSPSSEWLVRLHGGKASTLLFCPKVQLSIPSKP